jgi:hypothetical protein
MKKAQHTTNPQSSPRFRWKAELDPSVTEISANEPQIIVNPVAPILRVREGIQFTATVYGMDESEIFWEVRGAGNGDILNDGYYTAPNYPGVYEIIACSLMDRSIYGIAIVTVKEYPEKPDAD